MTDERQRTSAGVMIPIAILVAVALYFLSIGPTIWLYSRGYLRNGSPELTAVQLFYFPAEWLRDHNRFAKSILDPYVDLWRD